MEKQVAEEQADSIIKLIIQHQPSIIAKFLESDDYAKHIAKQILELRKSLCDGLQSQKGCVRLMMYLGNTFRRTVIDNMRRDGFQTRLIRINLRISANYFSRSFA